MALARGQSSGCTSSREIQTLKLKQGAVQWLAKNHHGSGVHAFLGVPRWPPTPPIPQAPRAQLPLGDAVILTWGWGCCSPPFPEWPPAVGLRRAPHHPEPAFLPQHTCALHTKAPTCRPAAPAGEGVGLAERVCVAGGLLRGQASRAGWVPRVAGRPPRQPDGEGGRPASRWWRGAEQRTL